MCSLSTASHRRSGKRQKQTFEVSTFDISNTEKFSKWLRRNVGNVTEWETLKHSNNICKKVKMFETAIFSYSASKNCSSPTFNVPYN